MRVLQPLAPGFDLPVQGGKCVDLAVVEGNDDGLLTAIARLQELDGDDSGLGRNGDQFEKAIGDTDLAVFQLEALCLEHTEELLDDPAALVPVDDTPGV